METENYAKATLLALNQSKEFAVRLGVFLLLEPILALPNCYHYGNSTLIYRIEFPEQLPEQLDEVRAHLALDLIARNTQTLAQDLAAIVSEFPEFSVSPFRQDSVALTEAGIPIIKY